MNIVIVLLHYFPSLLVVGEGAANNFRRLHVLLIALPHQMSSPLRRISKREMMCESMLSHEISRAILTTLGTKYLVYCFVRRMYIYIIMSLLIYSDNYKKD